MGSFHKIAAHPSGDITEYIAFSNIKTLLADAKAIAPPEPPSPIITDMIGTLKDMQHSIELAIACACPLCSAPMPGYAPGVSINEIIEPDYQIRFIWESTGGDTVAFVILASSKWAELEAKHGKENINKAFLVLVKEIDTFNYPIHQHRPK